MMRLAGTVARLPRYMQLARTLVQEPDLPKARKAALVAGFGYAILPFDLLPGIIPILGQLDDLGALLLGIRLALHGCEPLVAQSHLDRARLTQHQLDADLRTVGVATFWLGRKAVTYGARVVAGGVRLLQSLRRPRQPT